jgi:heat shock protein HtpX
VTSQLKTFFLLALLTGLILFLGQLMGGRTGLIVAFGFALVMNFVSYWYSDKIVLAMYKARPLAPEDAPALHAALAEMAAKAGIPTPRLVLIPQEAPNAFATGRNPQNAVVAVTEGLVRLLPLAEVKAVMGHELGHIAHRDILIQSVAAVLASAVMMLANMMQWAAIFGLGGRDGEERGNPLAALAVALFAPFAATLIQMAISRSREFLADAAGAEFSGQPLNLAQALARLHNASRELPMQANPATENMFIVSPFSGRRIGNWFSTHPPVEERIARLREMAGR